MKSLCRLPIQLIGALFLMMPIYQAWAFSPLETWMSQGNPGWEAMYVWSLILEGPGCVSAWMYVVGTMLGFSYLLGLVAMRAFVVWWRKRRAKPAPAWDPTASVAHWAAITAMSLPIYVAIANLMLRDTRVAQFAFWLRAPGNPTLPLPGGFGCLSHSHWVFYVIYAVSVLIAWRLIRWVEGHWLNRSCASTAP